MELNYTDDEIKNSLIPNWTFSTNDLLTPKTLINKYLMNNTINKEQIINEFNKTNKNNDLIEEPNDKFPDVVIKLNNLGIKFEFGLIIISKDDVIFPMCDVGKNRSQFMFYYLKNIQSKLNNVFLTGYPSSGDELKSINSDSNSILSSFKPVYKSDNFSDTTRQIFGKEISRSIHIFDNLLKKKEEYSIQDLKNYENYKYAQHKYEILDIKSNDIDKIKNLFINIFLNPQNVREIINKNSSRKITYLCLSPDSFYNICNLFENLKKKNPLLNLENTRIIYYGIKDIFQGSTIKKNVLYNFINKIHDSTFLY